MTSLTAVTNNSHWITAGVVQGRICLEQILTSMIRLGMFGEDMFEVRIVWLTADLTRAYYMTVLFYHREFGDRQYLYLFPHWREYILVSTVGVIQVWF